VTCVANADLAPDEMDNEISVAIDRAPLAPAASPSASATATP
jgi:hypothetical protein